MSWIRKKISIPKQYDPEDRAAIAVEIIDYIVNRSKDGLGKDGKAFPKYSKEYAKAKGVSETDVDLTLSAEMLDSIVALNSKSGELVIGFERGSDINGRAEGNIKGTYGQSTPNPKKARNFLDISDKEIKNILKEFPIKDKQKRKDRVNETFSNEELAELIAFDFEL
jgi:hypothetical protein